MKGIIWADDRAEALATTTPLPGVPLQIRNAPTKLMKKLGYGKHYSYNPDFAHPVYNVRHHLYLRRLTGRNISLRTLLLIHHYRIHLIYIS